MNTKFSTLFSAAAFVLTVAIAGPVLTADTAFAGDKKSDRLPVVSAMQNTCSSKILGTISDDCVQKVVEGAVIKKVKTTVVELRDEDAAISTLIRVQDLEIAGAAEPVQVQQ